MPASSSPGVPVAASPPPLVDGLALGADGGFDDDGADGGVLGGAVVGAPVTCALTVASPESTDLYLSVDHVRLIDCVLGVPAGARP